MNMFQARLDVCLPGTTAVVGPSPGGGIVVWTAVYVDPPTPTDHLPGHSAGAQPLAENHVATDLFGFKIHGPVVLACVSADGYVASGPRSINMARTIRRLCTGTDRGVAPPRVLKFGKTLRDAISGIECTPKDGRCAHAPDSCAPPTAEMTPSQSLQKLFSTFTINDTHQTPVT